MYSGNVSSAGNSDGSIFYQKPISITINEEGRTKYASSQKIEILIEELQEKGPLVALGKLGPDSYVAKPFKLNDRVQGLDIYGWKRGAEKKQSSKQNYVIVLGAKKAGKVEHIYFTLSDDVTSNSTNYTREHRPSSIDGRVYVVSHKTFSDILFDLYPPKEEEKGNGLSTSQNEYVKQLSCIHPLDSILDEGVVESKCKAIGQEIFEKYKKEAGGNTWAGKEAAQNICAAILSSVSDGSLRKQYIERAWDGIGDDKWRWQA